MKLLVTGSAGKVGQAFLPAFLAQDRFAGVPVVALCHNRAIAEGPRVEVVRGSVADAGAVARAMEGVSHVLHMAAVKESPDLAIDVAVKGMFVLLEAFRRAPAAERFVLIGGDCAVGHIFQPYDAPIDEAAPRRAYPGCYALTKVIEEVMLEQARHQYGLDGVILRAPWIMEKDDFRCALSFGPDQFGGPPWRDLLPAAELARCARGGHVPLMRDAGGAPLRRGFVHVDDVVSACLAALDHPAARGQTFNIAMDEPVDYGRVAALARDRYGLVPVAVDTPFHGNWLVNAKARQRLGWAPKVGLEALMDRAWSYERGPSEPRRIWYPG